MRDLYSHLGIADDATANAIRAAILRCDSVDVKDDAVTVLLVPERRRSFDKLLMQLRLLGDLRQQLHLQQEPSWCPELVKEFPGRQHISSAPVDPPVPFDTADVHPGGHARLKRWLRRIDSDKREVMAAFLIGVAVIALAYMPTESAPKRAAQRRSLLPARAQSTFEDSVQPEGASLNSREFSAMQLPRPMTGLLGGAPVSAHSAPLHLFTEPELDYYIKFESVESGDVALRAFVQGGDTLDALVPLGKYTMKYASGRAWYGLEHLFGPGTHYAMADESFAFTRDGDVMTGYKIRLQNIVNGNLATRGISKSEF